MDHPRKNDQTDLGGVPDPDPMAPVYAWGPEGPSIRTERLTIRLAAPFEVGMIVSFLCRNREHTRRWEPLHPPEFYSPAHWSGVPQRHLEEARRGAAFNLKALLHGHPEEFVASGGIRDVVRGDLQTGTIGYTVDVGHVSQGIATEFVRAMVWFAFEVLDLHRLEACHMPSNVASERVLTKCGFAREGLLRGSSRVNGTWEDHVLVSILNARFRGDAVPSVSR